MFYRPPLVFYPPPPLPPQTAVADFEAADRAKEEGEADLSLTGEDIDRWGYH